MCTTKLSPTAVTGSPVASISIPELSIDTCPCGSHSTWKIVGGSVGIVRWTSSRSVVVSVISASCHRPLRWAPKELAAMLYGHGPQPPEPPGARPRVLPRLLPEPLRLPPRLRGRRRLLRSERRWLPTRPDPGSDAPAAA